MLSRANVRFEAINIDKSCHHFISMQVYIHVRLYVCTKNSSPNTILSSCSPIYYPAYYTGRECDAHDIVAFAESGPVISKFNARKIYRSRKETVESKI